ncbi:MAG TPA: hypothetical protein VNH11_06350 [Pirellulales bacterium]|nr:hypothetical protein [Pirellulales bacterium]
MGLMGPHQFDWPIDRFQFPFFMDQRALPPADRTGLRPGHPLRTGEGQPFGGDLCHRPSQLMPSQLHVREPDIFLEQLAQRNFQSLGKAHKGLPLVFAVIFVRIILFILEHGRFFSGLPNPPSSAASIQKTFKLSD